MAEFNVDFPDDFLSSLLETDFDEIAEEALSDAVPILEKTMKAEVAKSIQHEGDSELVNSFKASKPKKTKTDAWIANVNPKGYSKTKVYTAVNRRGVKTGRKYPVSNALKAIWKEYGIPGRQAAKPFITASVNASRNEIMNRMQEVYNRKVGAGNGS